MKLFGLLFFGIFSMQLMAQDYKADDLLGTWLNEDKDGHVKIYKENGKYYGKLIWLKNPIDDETGKAKLDKHNDDEELQKRPLQDLMLLTDFVYDEDGEWDDGEIYDPKSGNTYSCYIKMESMDKIKVRGYIGISLIGRTTYWTRVK
ncbi:MAG: DUF2147 domain-containing protein [Chlorobi bacterium]|nr:DUF2147 domain-containing protein [Chlorobiota bacterium]